MLAASSEGDDVRDPWVDRMRSLPTYVVSSTLEDPLDWPDATVISGDASRSSPGSRRSPMSRCARTAA